MIPALCCVCGTVREVSRQAVRNYDRTRKLKCATCKAMTTHAGVFGPGTDWREGDNARKGVRPADPLEALRASGTRVHKVRGLQEPAIYCPDSDLAFVRAELSGEALERTARWLVDEAAQERESR